MSRAARLFTMAFSSCVPFENVLVSCTLVNYPYYYNEEPSAFTGLQSLRSGRTPWVGILRLNVIRRVSLESNVSFDGSASARLTRPSYAIEVKSKHFESQLVLKHVECWD